MRDAPGQINLAHRNGRQLHRIRTCLANIAVKLNNGSCGLFQPLQNFAVELRCADLARLAYIVSEEEGIATLL